MSRGLILDAGGVLIRSVGDAARREWEAAHGRTPGFLDTVVVEAIGPGWAGGRSEEEIDAELVRRTGIAAHELPDLHAVLGAHEQVDAVVADALRRVRPHCRIAVLSNAGPRRRAVLVDRFHVDQLVDVIVISAEERLAKPDPRIYQLTAERLDVAPDDCLFVDDTPVNVEAAVAAGMTGLLFRDHATFTTALRRHISEHRTEVTDDVAS